MSENERRHDPWWLHLILYSVIAVLAYMLAQVAIIQPGEIVAQENYYKNESRLRMKNLMEAEILWEERHGKFTGSLDSLITFVKTDSLVQAMFAGKVIDSITNDTVNPFHPLTSGEITPDSFRFTPKTGEEFIVKIDTTTQLDSLVKTRGGEIVSVKVDTTIVTGKLYMIEDPAGYGSVGDLDNVALKNAASWE
ncbi:MAG: hypothetical protein GF419_11180 [Ignavibacteriales bacterium]|jgi:hypothetical protein|nr:hypothetical protein [Ignavibacteriales bacterium]